ncbi:MAG: HpcH/HpaI aldolase/citrate lyase family protein [Acidimicrobiales bacterium]
MSEQSPPPQLPPPRSWIFGPAGRTDYVAKFAACGADAGILDLEDATPEHEKANHRATLVNSADGLGVEGLRLFIRTNSPGTVHFEADVEAAALVGVDGIVVPMLTSANEVQYLREVMGRSGLGAATLVGGIETAAAVLDAREICGAGLDFVYFGAEDFIADLGGVRSASNHECAVARSMVVMAAASARIGAIDQVVTEIDDSARFAREATEARNMGFSGKLCIHPSQVPVANAAFDPTEAELSWAQGVLEAASDAAQEGRGAVKYQGQMIDAPAVSRARQLLARFGGRK